MRYFSRTHPSSWGAEKRHEVPVDFIEVGIPGLCTIVVVIITIIELVNTRHLFFESELTTF